MAYGDLPASYRADRSLELLCSSINHAGLQQHLLAMPTAMLVEAVRTKIEFLQVRPEGRLLDVSRRQLQNRMQWSRTKLSAS